MFPQQKLAQFVYLLYIEHFNLAKKVNGTFPQNKLAQSCHMKTRIPGFSIAALQ